MVDDLNNLEQLLDHIDSISQNAERVSLDIIVEAVGRRSFGPLLLLVGVILASPLSGIPGMPTLMGIFVILIAAQLPFSRRGFWLPQWLLQRSVTKSKADKAIAWLRHPARFIDRWLRPRLTFLVRGSSIYYIAVICIILAVLMPLMELVPFSASGAGAVLAAFGLSLVAYDGALALLAYLLSVMTAGLVIFSLL